MKISIVEWTEDRKEVHIYEIKTGILSITQTTDKIARIWVPDCSRLDSDEAKAVARTLELAAKVAGYLDDLEPDEARDAILGLPTTPYDGWQPMPRAGRTEN